MEERINDKIKEVEELLSDLEDIRTDNIDEYIKDIKTRAACERYFEKVIEAVIDLSFLIIKQRELRIPEGDEGALRVLVNKGIIDETLFSKLSNAKGMRNFIIHQYEKIDDKLVFDVLNGELQRDVVEFLDAVRGMR